ncbi:MAG TPA: hypothetical protein VFH58_02605 [Acidimicrobiales bacterium]|nr:hypothetical protein [Acidimicrobiales bacterium]
MSKHGVRAVEPGLMTGQDREALLEQNERLRAPPMVPGDAASGLGHAAAPPDRLLPPPPVAASSEQLKAENRCLDTAVSMMLALVNEALSVSSSPPVV